MPQGITNGVGEVRFHKWQHFGTFINQVMLDHDSYVWRGQRRDDWQLDTTLSRLMKKSANPDPYTFQETHLNQFKEASRGRRGPNPPTLDNDNEWWALGQHHGLATPLLDWTASPFVAAFFAFHELALDKTKYRVVYGLHRASVEEKVENLIKARKEKGEAARKQAEANGNPLNGLALAFNSATPAPEIEFIRPRSDENQRLLAQGGLFTRQRKSTGLHTWIAQNFVGDDRYRLIRLMIPDSDREEALRMLNRMNINHATLFPDLTGASDFCNVSRQINAY